MYMHFPQQNQFLSQQKMVLQAPITGILKGHGLHSPTLRYLTVGPLRPLPSSLHDGYGSLAFSVKLDAFHHSFS